MKRKILSLLIFTMLGTLMVLAQKINTLTAKEKKEGWNTKKGTFY